MLKKLFELKKKVWNFQSIKNSRQFESSYYIQPQIVKHHFHPQKLQRDKEMLIFGHLAW
jgi:hypothetical protein